MATGFSGYIKRSPLKSDDSPSVLQLLPMFNISDSEIFRFFASLIVKNGTMLKSITFDGDASTTLNTLMGYIEKLDKALEELRREQAEQPIFVKEGSRIIRVRREEILYLEGYGDYVKIHRVDGKPLLSQISLRRFEGVLSSRDFCRVHRSYIVAIQHISYIERKRIRIGEELIPISDSYMPSLMNRLVLQE